MRQRGFYKIALHGRNFVIVACAPSELPWGPLGCARSSIGDKADEAHLTG